MDDLIKSVLEDHELLAEIRLVADLIVEAGRCEERLDQPTIDRLLGLGPGAAVADEAGAAVADDTGAAVADQTGPV